ncbi:hypothetical protein CALVIDRAFT_251172 [Calocera viscosa TUFC12733]|uniref:Carbohydrate-binding module family 18 protein n=1 Tax=Calocera viscosa (strain TUFC12733) TaxID=1330018 RepID=A0A167JFG9_CALVF|nr:hypothetical protein CALVIDRAFT_251172 [Calocera viscosa TUFC12733]
MVAPRLLILLLNLVCLASLRSVVTQNAGGAAAAGLVACSNDATCTAAFESGVHCAPDGYCADSGAACSSNAFCFDSCGSDGICGGVGALCDTDNNDDYIGYKCDAGNTCTGTFTMDGAPTGVCEPSGASTSSAAGAAGLTECSSDATCLLNFDAAVHCAPDGYCADAGAACSSNEDCWGQMRVAPMGYAAERARCVIPTTMMTTMATSVLTAIYAQVHSSRTGTRLEHVYRPDLPGASGSGGAICHRRTAC